MFWIRSNKLSLTSILPKYIQNNYLTLKGLLRSKTLKNYKIIPYKTKKVLRDFYT